MFLLHISYWLHFYLGSFSYTSHAGFIFIWGVSLRHSVLALILSGVFLLNIPSWIYISVGSFSYTTLWWLHFLIWGVSLTYPLLASFLCGEFLLNIPCCRDFYVGSFSYTSHADFVFMCRFSLTHPMLPSFFIWGVSLTHPVLSWFLCKQSYWLHFYRGSFSCTSRAGFIFIWGVSLTHPMLASFLSGEFLLHISCSLYFITLKKNRK